jgi:hypothetical protein
VGPRLKTQRLKTAHPAVITSHRYYFIVPFL